MGCLNRYCLDPECPTHGKGSGAAVENFVQDVKRVTRLLAAALPEDTSPAIDMQAVLLLARAQLPHTVRECPEEVRKQACIKCVGDLFGIIIEVAEAAGMGLGLTEDELIAIMNGKGKASN